jgi:prepilin-type processing-associated H-X9-DG protein
MKQIAYALHMYADDNDQTYPGWNIYTDAGGNLIAWDEAIMPYLTSSKVYLCGSQRNQNAKPTAQTFWGRNYSMNAFYGSGEGYPFPCIYVASLKRPADRILISETSGGYGYHNPHVWSPADRSMIVTNDETMTAGLYTTMTPLLHNGGSNYIFCDTHVQWLKYSRTVEGFPNDMWNLQNQ